MFNILTKFRHTLRQYDVCVKENLSMQSGNLNTTSTKKRASIQFNVFEIMLELNPWQYIQVK